MLAQILERESVLTGQEARLETKTFWIFLTTSQEAVGFSIILLSECVLLALKKYSIRDSSSQWVAPTPHWTVQVMEEQGSATFTAFTPPPGGELALCNTTGMTPV